MRWAFALVVCILTLAACTNTADTTTTIQNQTPESVNTAWIEALKTNNRQAALLLVGDLGGKEQQTLFVDQMLRRMSGMLDPSLPPGGLVSIQEFTPVPDGQDMLGKSLWTFAKTKRCYESRMTPQQNEWKVINWGERAVCPNT